MMITKLRHQLFGLRKDKFGSTGERLEQLGLKLQTSSNGKKVIIRNEPKRKPVTNMVLINALKTACFIKQRFTDARAQLFSTIAADFNTDVPSMADI